MPTLSRFGMLLRFGRPPNPREGPPRVRSRQAGTVVTKEADEKVRLASRKEPRSAESARGSGLATRRFWLYYIYLHPVELGMHVACSTQRYVSSIAFRLLVRLVPL